MALITGKDRGRGVQRGPPNTWNIHSYSRSHLSALHQLSRSLSICNRSPPCRPAWLFLLFSSSDNLLSTPTNYLYEPLYHPGLLRGVTL